MEEKRLLALYIGDAWLSTNSLSLKGVFTERGLAKAIEVLKVRDGLIDEEACELISNSQCRIGVNRLLIQEIRLNELDTL